MSGADDQRLATGAPPARPGDDLLFIAVGAAVMVVFLTFNALNVYHEAARAGHVLAAWKPAIWEASSGLVFLCLTPIMMALTRRVWPADRPYLRKLVIHLGAAILISLSHVLVSGVMRWAAYRVLNDYYSPLAPVKDWAYEFRKDVLVYAGIVGSYVAWLSLRRPAVRGDDSDAVLEVRDGARRHFVPLGDVLWVEAAGNYVELHRGGAGLLHRASLLDMERQLQPAGFVRIHRSRLVRREAVAAIESKSTGDFTVRLRDGRELAGSRRYRRPLLAD